MRFLGIDLAWGEGSEEKPANRSGVVALESDGRISDAGWTIGIEKTIEWVEHQRVADTLAFIDAPLVVTNVERQRLADKQVGQRYGRWWVSANSINTSSPRQGGVRLRTRLEALGWSYSDGRAGPVGSGCVMSECYPYTTIVGVEQLGYDRVRPPYKRASKGKPASQAWPIRTAACADLIQRIAKLRTADPPIDLMSHPETARLVSEPSPAKAVAYKKREDLLDAAICAWTAAYWALHGPARSQVLGISEHPEAGLLASIIAPARGSQRGH